MIATCELPPTAQHLVVSTPRTSRFYMLPKIHKPNSPGRPIVSACYCPTENITAYLDEVMAPLVSCLPTCIKDTNDALRIFDTFTFDSSNDNPRLTISASYAPIPRHAGLSPNPRWYHIGASGDILVHSADASPSLTAAGSLPCRRP